MENKSRLTEVYCSNLNFQLDVETKIKLVDLIEKYELNKEVVQFIENFVNNINPLSKIYTEEEFDEACKESYEEGTAELESLERDFQDLESEKEDMKDYDKYIVKQLEELLLEETIDKDKLEKIKDDLKEGY